MTLNGSQPLFTMRVYPEGRSLYFRVNVWPTKKAMHKHVTWSKPPYEALCSPYTRIDYKNGKPRTSPECGQVNFHKNQIGSAVITHEFTHAVLAWARRVKLNPANLFDNDEGASAHPDEERFCHALDRMIGTFIDRAYKERLF